MHCSIAAAIAALLVPAALAVPFNSMRLAARQLPPSTNVLNPDFPIHDSCNASQQLQLKQGFADMKLFAQSALDHLLHYGHTSDLAKLYFGNETNVTPAIGAYVRLLSADKAATLFRCDNPDGNCALEGYGGHWRGENGTDETVICELSFQTRLPIEKVCSNGFQLGTDKVNIFWGTDLLHRVFHLPAITDGGITHVADSYAAAIELAKTTPNETVSNQNTLQFFAFDVFSRTIVPNGCIGNIKPDDGHVEGHDVHDVHADHDAHDHDTTAAANSTAPAGECHMHGNVRHCD